MKSPYINKINDSLSEPLTPDEIKILEQHIEVKLLKKRQYFLQEGDVCKSIAFIKKGILKQYSVDNKGTEYILQLAVESWIIGDLYSFTTQKPAFYNIEAIEDTDLLLISKSSQDILIKEIPKYETFVRNQITRAYLSMQQRLTDMISLAPEERYLKFISSYPDITQRVPQHMIASYIGLKPETLSRIRKKIFIK